MTDPSTGSRAATVLPVGTRVRCKFHPELLGRIEGYEWNDRESE